MAVLEYSCMYWASAVLNLVLENDTTTVYSCTKFSSTGVRVIGRGAMPMHVPMREDAKYARSNSAATGILACESTQVHTADR
jgi:hypothetical protein